MVLPELEQLTCSEGFAARSHNFETLRVAGGHLDKRLRILPSDLQEHCVRVLDSTRHSRRCPAWQRFWTGSIREPTIAFGKLDNFEKELIRIRYQQVIGSCRGSTELTDRLNYFSSE